MAGIAAGLTCLGWVCLAVLYVYGGPGTEARPGARWGCAVLAILFFVIAAGMFFGLIKA